MKSWNELTRTQQIPLGVLVIIIVILVPESAFLLDAGGVELIIFFLTMYSQNLKLWLDLHFGMITYPIIDSRTYVKSVSFTSILFWITSSFAFSSAFFLVLVYTRNG